MNIIIGEYDREKQEAKFGLDEEIYAFLAGAAEKNGTTIEIELQKLLNYVKEYIDGRR